MTTEFLAGGAIAAVIFIDLAARNKKLTGYAFIVFALILSAMAFRFSRSGQLLNGAYLSDGLAHFAKAVILVVALLTGMLSLGTLRIRAKYYGAYYALLLSSALGMMFLVSSIELVTMYVALETVTISVYGLVAINKEDDLSLEAGIKYLILGALSSGILLFGLSVIYAFAGTLRLDEILNRSGGFASEPFFIVGIVLAVLGVGFKLSMVPMHVWTPDVYQGAPTPITAFISVASKIVGFVFAIRLFKYSLAGFDHVWLPILAVLAFATMTFGNLAAIPQKNIKRLLAYSTISQVGYILVGFVGSRPDDLSSVLFYLPAYAATNIAAFAAVIGFSHVTGSDEVEDYVGLAQKEPVLALAFAIALLSLAGIPPLAGFVGKFYLFYAAMEKGYLWLVIAAALNSTVSLYYYLLVLKQMYIFDGKKEYPKIRLPLGVALVILTTIAAVFILGVFPGAVMNITDAIAQNLMMR
jgi:NADH-quinone oxidoreductase subunit N